MCGVNHNEMPLVSIITICRNAEKGIADTVKSVLCQTYRNMEYIVVDGKSSDRTLEEIEKIVKEYDCSNIHILSEEDGGISDAMNKGIRLANGKVLCHLHAGDRFISDGVLNRVMNSYEKGDWRWAAAGSVAVSEQGQAFHVYSPCSNKNMLLKKNCIPHQSTFIAKDVFEKHGLFKKDFKQAMDYEFWLRIAFKGGEDLTVLPFNATYFSSGGRSSNIAELLKYLGKTRKLITSYGAKTGFIRDVIFLTRVFMFHIWGTLKEFFTTKKLS